MCKKQTSVSHSFTESEVISLDAGLRMEGIPALDLWDVVIRALHSSKTTHPHPLIKHGETSRAKKSGAQIPTQSLEGEVTDMLMNELSNLDHVVTNARSCQVEAQLYIFEDNEAVIKTITKGRSPMMRHVSRTHRDALDWLCDRVSLDTKIQINYVDTKNPLADMLTKGNFTRGEWKHLLRLFNIMNFSMFSCSHFLSITKRNIMSKRAQDRKTEEGLVVAKSRPACFGIKKLERKTTTPAGSGRPTQPGASRVGSEFCFHKHWGDPCGTEARTQQRVLKSGKEMTIRFQALGDQCGVCVGVQAQVDLCEGSTTNLQGRSWTTTIFKSPTINTLRTSSQVFDRS